MRALLLRPASGVTLLILLGFMLLAQGAIPQISRARQATPAATPVAESCDAAPRAIGEILRLTEPTPGEGLPVLPLPAGEPADPDTTAAIAAVLEEMGACLTAGEMLRFYALHSDDWLRRFAGDIAGLATLTASTPPLADGDRAVYLGPWNVQILPDDRVLAAVLLRVGNELRPDPSRTRVLLFVRHDGRWLVDETIEEVSLAECEDPVEVGAVVGPPPGAVFDAWSVSC